MYSYITVLSNFILGYDKYRRIYSKKNIFQSTFKDEFYLLKQEELSIGCKKAIKLQKKLNLKDNFLIKIDTNPLVQNIEIEKNERNGLGYLIRRNEIFIEKIWISKDIKLDENNISWTPISLEECASMSLKIHNGIDFSYEQLSPLTFSFLPIALACQAKCKFCFSHASISYENNKKLSDFDNIEDWMKESAKYGAKRFVITGGGEPGLFGLDNLCSVIKKSKDYFKKTILFTNGIFIERKSSDIEILKKLHKLKLSGLDTLSLSVHHYNPIINTHIMGTNTNFERIIDVAKNTEYNIPTIRLICVLQKSGIQNVNDINQYIEYALRNNISEICFKELYVSSGTDSIYATLESNIYSEKNQVGLHILTNYAIENNLKKVSELPWGSPVYLVEKDGKTLTFAAYTEPSVGWELKNKIARSWNYLSDKNCYASLEDKNSLITLPFQQKVI